MRRHDNHVRCGIPNIHIDARLLGALVLTLAAAAARFASLLGRSQPNMLQMLFMFDTRAGRRRCLWYVIALRTAVSADAARQHGRRRWWRNIVIGHHWAVRQWLFLGCRTATAAGYTTACLSLIGGRNIPAKGGETQSGRPWCRCCCHGRCTTLAGRRTEERAPREYRRRREEKRITILDTIDRYDTTKDTIGFSDYRKFLTSSSSHYRKLRGQSTPIVGI